MFTPRWVVFVTALFGGAPALRSQAALAPVYARDLADSSYAVGLAVDRLVGAMRGVESLERVADEGSLGSALAAAVGAARAREHRRASRAEAGPLWDLDFSDLRIVSATDATALVTCHIVVVTRRRMSLGDVRLHFLRRGRDWRLARSEGLTSALATLKLLLSRDQI
jgi:hypothetical protein